MSVFGIKLEQSTWEGCGGQADKLADYMTTLDTGWNYEVTPVLCGGHYVVIATRSENDPMLLLDPWMGQFYSISEWDLWYYQYRWGN